MAEAADLAETVGFGALLFKAADEDHLVKQAEKLFTIYLLKTIMLLRFTLLVLLLLLRWRSRSIISGFLFNDPGPARYFFGEDARFCWCGLFTHRINLSLHRASGVWETKQSRHAQVHVPAWQFSRIKLGD